jgi:hypothetical protein
MASVAGKSAVVEWQRDGSVGVLAYGFPGMPMGAGLNAHGIALCWTSASLGNKEQLPRVGIPSYALISHLLAQPDLDSVIREARKNKHAGWFTFVLADGDGNLLNIEGSPLDVVVERATGDMVRVGYGSRAMTGTAGGGEARVHPRCRKMYDLLDDSRGRNDLVLLQSYFADREYTINQGKGTIDMMVFDTTARTAYLSRGTSYGLDWQKFAFADQPRVSQLRATSN